MAEGNLGNLVVQITTDLSNLNAGLKKAEETVRNTTGKITDLTNKVGIAMTAAGAAITGAFGLAVKSTLDYNEIILRVSEQSGIAVDRLSELKYAAEQTESSFEGVTIALKFLNRNIYDANNGNTQASKSFETLGISIRDSVTGEALKANDVFLQIADKFKNLSDESAKTALAIQIFGRSGTSIIPMLNLGSEGITRLSEEAHKLGIVLTTQNAKDIDRFGDSLRTLKESFGGLWLNISLLIIPILEKLTKFLTDAIIVLREFSEVHPILARNIATLTLVFGALMLAIGPLLIAIPPLIIMFAALDVALAPVLGTILIIVGAIGALTLVVANAKNIWQGFLKFLQPTIEFWTGKKFDIQKPEEKNKESSETTASQTTVLDETITKVQRHTEALKELNENYLTGKINAEDYYNEVQKLHIDGLDIKQQELELLRQSIELEYLATDAEYQKIYVMQQGIQSAQEYYRVKAELQNQDLMDQQITLNSATNLLRTIEGMHKTIWQGIFDFVNMGIQKFSSGFSTALTGIIMGTKTAGEAFKEFGVAMLQAIVEFVVQYAVQALIAMTIGGWITAATIAFADGIAAAWLPAAILASIATMGAADAAGTAALGGAMASSIGMLAAMKGAQAASAGAGLTTMAKGGSGIATKPTLFLAGEAGPERYSFTPLDKEGGGNTYGDINIELNAIINNDMDIKEVAEKLGSEIEQQLRGARRSI